MPKSYKYTPGIGSESNIYIVNIGFVNIYKISGSIKDEFEGKIVEPSTEVIVDDVEEVLTEALPNGVRNADNNVNDFSTMPIGQISDAIKIIVDSKIIKRLTRARFDDTENVIAIQKPKE